MGCSQSKHVVEGVEAHVKPALAINVEKAPNGQVSCDSSHHSSASNSSRKSLSRSVKGIGGLTSISKSKSFVGLDTMNEVRQQEGNLMTNCIPFELPLGRAIEEVYDGVHDGEVLGSGISGVVRLATHKATGHKYAVKCLDLDLIEPTSGLQQLRDEIYIMCQLDHPNIIRLEEVYESHHEIFLVQELCLGGELFDRLDEQPDYHYTETQCADLVKQMLCSVRYLHSKGIIHRDLKLENFLFASTSADSELKMIDFGLSKHFKFGEVQHDSVGTPYTVAPEVIRGSYDARCDIWGIGVIAYLLLSGDPPFGGCGGPESLQTVRNNILSGYYKYEPQEIWEGVSDQAKDFIKALLVTDPSKRPDAEGAQRLPWIKTFSDKKNGPTSKLNPNVVRSLVSFKEYSDMRKLLCEVLSFALLPEQIKNLRKEFEVLDKEGTGEISLQSLKTVLMSSAGAGSLGALSESEIEDIFNAMRVRETETTIHWHEFIAAGLSQCQVDDRNLRLAFDRMDAEHKGYITFKNVLNLLGSDGASEERVRRLYFNGLEDYQINDVHITYEHFLAVMKGQSTSDLLITTPAMQDLGMPMDDMMGLPLDVVPESNDSLGTNESPSLLVAPARSIDKGMSESDIGRDSTSSMDSQLPAVPSNVRRTLNLPEHNHDDASIEILIHDESKTPLVVNRNLYRAHRQMRQAVLDASKRLEEAQMRRLVREEEEKSLLNVGASAMSSLQSAGLVMRRGQRERMSTEEVRKILNARISQQQAQMAKANKQAGRGRRRRKKTVSDMTGMLGELPDKKSTNISSKIVTSCPPSPALTIEVTHDESASPNDRIPFLPGIHVKEEEPKTHRKMDSDSELFSQDPPSPAIQQNGTPVSLQSGNSQTRNFPPPPPL